MPDITMCTNKDCVIRGKCYRYRAVSEKFYQSYSFFECENEYSDYFLTLYPDDILRETEEIDAEFEKNKK